MKRSLIFSAILGLVIAILISFSIKSIGKRDLVAYWSASNLLIQGKNPYDEHLLLALQSQENQGQEEVISSAWNPPWLLVSFFPFAILPFDVAAFLWIWTSIFILGLCVYLCLRMAGNTGTGRSFIGVFSVCIFFLPTLFLLGIGQVSLLVLLGLVGGIYALKRGSYPLAGALLVLATIKPHLSYLALVWIAWWVIRNRKWSVLTGAGMVIAGSIVVTVLLYPGYFRSYIELLGNMNVSGWYTSTLWSYLEVITEKPVFHWYGVLLLPLAFLVQPSAAQNDWLPKLGVILVTSISFAPYGYTFDQVLLLPVIVQILVWGMDKKLPRGLWWGALGGLAAINAGIVYLMAKQYYLYSWYFWVPFAVLLIYAFTFLNIIPYRRVKL